MAFPLATTTPKGAGLRPEPLDLLIRMIERHVKEGTYPGCQIALARNGKLALFKTFGDARVEAKPVKAKPDTLWLLYSNTKVITASALWLLAERGHFGFTDPVAQHLPGFEKHGKEAITILQLLTHQGGFPGAEIETPAWADHDKLRDAVCDIRLEWPPGSKLHYHPLAAHWVAGALIEAVTGRDFRDFIRAEILKPLGLEDEIYIGLPKAKQGRAAIMYDPAEKGASPKPRHPENTPAWWEAGVPGGGGYGTARGMVAFYQMLLGKGALGRKRIFSPRTIEYAIRNYTGDRVDEYMGIPMHRGLGPHLRGSTPTIRGMGSYAHPLTFGHGGVGSSYCWADPNSGVSFAYITNCRIPDPWHSWRLDRISNFVHAAIV